MTYQRGDRIVLVHTSDPHIRLIPGTAGTVTSYNARHGQLAVAWDDGSTLSMLLNDGDQVRPLDSPQPPPERLPSDDGTRTAEITPHPGGSHHAAIKSTSPPAGTPPGKDTTLNRADLGEPGRGCPPQDITDPATGGSRLLSERCSTCILRAGDPMYLGPERLRAVIGDALAAGTFVVCHDTLTYGDYPDYGPAICRGFFDAYADRSPALILLRACRRLVEVPPPEAASPGPASAEPGKPRQG